MTGIYIYGAGGHGKVVFHTFTLNQQIVTAFIDDRAQGRLCDVPVFSPQAISHNLSNPSVHFAIGNNAIRQKLQTEWKNKKASIETAIHLNSTIYNGGIIGSGSLITAGAIIGPDAVIGQGCIINHNAVVDHDCIIGDFCHIAPSATLGGTVKLGKQCFVGAGATILPSLTIGDHVTIGAGAVVIRDIPDNVTVVGCPARIIY